MERIVLKIVRIPFSFLEIEKFKLKKYLLSSTGLKKSLQFITISEIKIEFTLKFLLIIQFGK